MQVPTPSPGSSLGRELAVNISSGEVQVPTPSPGSSLGRELHVKISNGEVQVPRPSPGSSLGRELAVSITASARCKSPGRRRVRHSVEKWLSASLHRRGASPQAVAGSVTRPRFRRRHHFVGEMQVPASTPASSLGLDFALKKTGSVSSARCKSRRRCRLLLSAMFYQVIFEIQS